MQGNIDMSCKAFEVKSKVKVSITNTNNFKTGGTANYQSLAEVPVANQHVLLDVKTNAVKLL